MSERQRGVLSHRSRSYVSAHECEHARGAELSLTFLSMAKTVGVRTSSARSRFALGALALAIAVALAAPALAGFIGAPIELVVFALVALFGAGIGYGCGRRFEALEVQSLED